jgi:hypothetical protein
MEGPRGRSPTPHRVRNCHSPISARRDLGSTQPAIQWVQVALSPELKWQGREADPRGKKTWIYTSIPPCVFMM